MALRRGEALRLALRAFFLQVFLNYRTMQGCGYLFALWPWLRHRHSKPGEVRAAADYLNAHPVFAALAIGALRRRIEDGDAERDPQAFAEWQTALCGPLGVMGDVLIWDRWKPLIFATGVLWMLWIPRFEVWVTVAILALLLYNIPLFWFRVWGVREGYRLGTDVLTALRRPVYGYLRRGFTLAGAVLAGLLLAAGLVRTGVGSTTYGSQFLMAFTAAFIGIRLRWTITWILLVSIGTAMLLPAAVRLVGLPAGM